jgi:hypothetical protein
LPELFLGEPAQAIDQGRSDQAFLPRAMATLASEGAPGAPALERDLVDFVALGDLIRLVVGRRSMAGRKRGERECDPGNELRVCRDSAYGKTNTVRTPPSSV